MLSKYNDILFLSFFVNNHRYGRALEIALWMFGRYQKTQTITPLTSLSFKSGSMNQQQRVHVWCLMRGHVCVGTFNGSRTPKYDLIKAIKINIVVEFGKRGHWTLRSKEARYSVPFGHCKWTLVWNGRQDNWSTSCHDLSFSAVFLKYYSFFKTI